MKRFNAKSMLIEAGFKKIIYRFDEVQTNISFTKDNNNYVTFVYKKFGERVNKRLTYVYIKFRSNYANVEVNLYADEMPSIFNNRFNLSTIIYDLIGIVDHTNYRYRRYKGQSFLGWSIDDVEGIIKDYDDNMNTNYLKDVTDNDMWQILEYLEYFDGTVTYDDMEQKVNEMLLKNYPFLFGNEIEVNNKLTVLQDYFGLHWQIQTCYDNKHLYPDEFIISKTLKVECVDAETARGNMENFDNYDKDFDSENYIGHYMLIPNSKYYYREM